MEEGVELEYTPSFRNILYADIQPSYNDSLTHHGIKGMHWGVRRYQNPDGSLTPKGKKRYKKSIDYISDIKKGNNAVREIVNDRYATARNNYEVNRDAKKEMIDDGSHTEESFRKMYPNYDIGTDYDKRTLDYHRDQIKLIDAMTKKLDDIDVTQQSYKRTKKLVDDIIDDSTIKLSDLKNNYVNSDEYIKYRDMINRTNAQSKRQTQKILDKYRL